MARYIDVEGYRKLFDEEYKKTRKLISEGETHLDNLAEGFSEASRVIDLIPTADVVPSAEVERLQHILDCYALQYGTVKDQQSAIDKAKAEVEKEIGEEIYRIIGDGDNETWVCLLIRELADKLKKKDESQN